MDASWTWEDEYDASEAAEKAAAEKAAAAKAAEQLSSAPRALPCPPAIIIRAAPPPDSNLHKGEAGGEEWSTVGGRGAKKLSDGRGGHEGGSTHWGVRPLNPGQLTNAIKDCRALGELARILRAQRVSLDHIHVSAAWVCLARMATGRGGGEVGGVVAALQDRTRDVLGQINGRGVANVLHSMSKLHQKGERADRGLLEAMQRRATATAG
ncbi:hypothetical protein T484DRAFT_1839704, partial [Baffinella frigidus]